MSTNYTFVNSALTGNSTPVALDDYFISKAPFTQGGLWTWGSNTYAQLGNNNIAVTKVSSPIQIYGGGTNWKQISGGSLFHSAGIKTDGTLWLWGNGGNGELGNGTTINAASSKSSPVETTVGGTNWKQVSTGEYFTHAIKSDGTLWAWGSQADGRLGNGINDAVTYISTPIQVGTDANWKQVSAGYGGSSAIKTDGTLWSWGYNLYGQVGIPTSTVRVLTPVQITGGGTNWKQISCGHYHVAAIKTDGSLWTWGYGLPGTLGDETTVNKSTPVQTILGGYDWKQVECGSYFLMAIKTDGTLWGWGQNTYGQLGLGASQTASKSTPVQISGGGTNWKQVTCGNSQSSAIKSNGTLWAWGFNNNGRLGDGTIIDKNTPVQIGTETYWKEISSGSDHTVSIRTDYY